MSGRARISRDARIWAWQAHLASIEILDCFFNGLSESYFFRWARLSWNSKLLKAILEFWLWRAHPRILRVPRLSRTINILGSPGLHDNSQTSRSGTSNLYPPLPLRCAHPVLAQVHVAPLAAARVTSPRGTVRLAESGSSSSSPVAKARVQ